MYQTLDSKEAFVPQALPNKKGLPYEREEKYTLSIDKLNINLIPFKLEEDFNRNYILNTYQERNGYYLINAELVLKENTKSDKKESNYECRFDIYIEGESVGYLATDCRTFRSSRLVKLAFFNITLYTSDWYCYYQTIVEGLGLRFNNISYLEIAYDSHCKLETYKYLYKNSVNSGNQDYIKGAKALYKATSKIIVGTQNNEGQYVIGRKESGKQIAIYNKSAELVKSKKHYITKFHERNGLDTTKQIDRLELRLNSKYLSRYNIKLSDLDCSYGLLGIFKKFTENSLSFHDLSTRSIDSNRNYKYEKVDLINFINLPVKEFRKVEKYGTKDTRRTTKAAFKNILYDYLERGNSVDGEYLKEFVRTRRIADFEFDSRIGFLQTVEASLNEFRRITKFYVKEYDRKINDSINDRISSIEDYLFAF